MKIRIMVIAIAIAEMFCSLHISQAQDCKKNTIIFVCEHGGARSTIASVYFNKLAKENNLPYLSVFRAITPDSTISSATKAGLTADGFTTSSLVPTAISRKELIKGVMLISIDCAVPDNYPLAQAWTGIPPINNDYNKARNEILKQLNTLIEELKKEKVKIDN